MKRFLTVLVPILLIAGCQAEPKKLSSAGEAPSLQEVEQLRSENQKLLREREALEKEIVQLKGTPSVEEEPRAERHAEVPLAGEEYEVTRITFGMLTNAISWDDSPGDDGIAVFVTPRDRRGDAIKRAGSLTFDLFDLRQKEKPLVATWSIGQEELEASWVEFPLGYYLRLPWQGDAPPAGKLILQGTFTDLTGKTFTALKEVRVQ